jgi:hypothetical protein
VPLLLRLLRGFLLLRGFEDPLRASCASKLFAGVVAVMTLRSWTVGALIEIVPKNKSLLGWNKNAGETIALRLRREGTNFYDLEQLLSVLCHELAHNVSLSPSYPTPDCAQSADACGP